jgi:hypothetical protein
MGLIADLIRTQQPLPRRHSPEPIQVVTTRPAPPDVPPVMDCGLLDDAPSPRMPDPVVFGTWLPGPQQPWPVLASCRCGCGQRDPGRCWNCGATVPWQWND